MKAIVFGALIACLITLAIGAAVAPQPYCVSKPLYKQFPLVMQQILSHDMAQSFSGYNLDIQLTSNNTFATMSKKIRELDRVNTYLANVISHYIEKKDNSVGKDSFLLYKDFTGSYRFTYGAITDKSSLPQFNVTNIVTTDKNVQCFDAALFLDYGIAIVDCLRVNVNNMDQPFTNIFFYLDLTGHKVTKIVQNQVYADFNMVTKRKLVRFTNPQTHYPYLIRSYYSEGVLNQKDNTYIEFFGAQDPFDLQIFAVVDRTFLHTPKLAINDVQVYNGDIFFLDEFVGLYRLDVTRDHKLLITGKMRKPGFEKFSVYSDDLQDQIIVALSNKHNVYEVDWSWQYMFTHEVINKYTIPSDSEVRDIKVNDKYVIVQSKANVTNSQNSTYEVDYTWIFTKGSRTYMNAYQIINHNSSKVDIQFDPSLNHIYTADQAGLALFKIDEARLNLHFIKQILVGTTEEVVITAISTDPTNKNKTMNCTQKMTVIFSKKQDLTIYPTGFQMHTQYSANYPGQVYIPLDRRFMGPNITFGTSNFEGQTPVQWVDKVNQTIFSMNTTVRPQDVTFFHTDMLQEYGQEILLYFFEDTTNKTHIANCIHAWQEVKMNCRIQRQYQHDSRLSSFTTGFIIDQENNDWDFFYFMVLEGQKNQIRMIDYVRHKIITNITYQGHQQAQIHHIATSNGYLYVLRKNIKTIDVYNLLKCKKNLKCTLEFRIDMYAMKNLGVDYFSPQQIITDAQHPQVLFIKCLGSVIILDVDNLNKLHLIDMISSTATHDINFRIAVNKYRMILASQPNIIEEYSLESVYQKDLITLMKTYPMYGYRIQPGADIQFSDLDFTVYVNAYDPAVNVSVILVYRSGFPSSVVLYHTIYLDQLYSQPGFQVEVSGNVVDFVSIAAGNQFKVYRVFDQPMLNFKTSVHDFNFTIKAQNNKSMLLTDKIGVSIVNFPSGFAPTKLFNDTVANLKTSKQGNYTWQDRKWFDGHVLNYNYSCKQCNATNPKVKLREHLDNINPLQTNGNDFIQTIDGGIGVHEDLLLFRHNGSIKQIINLPDQKLLETCLKVASFETGQFVVTACQQLGTGINLYVTSLITFKPITLGPFSSDAYHARNLQVIHDVVMVVNQNAYPEFRILAGSVFLYRVSVNPNTLEQFDFLDQIDNDDLLAAHGWTNEDAIIGNAYMTFSTLTNAFRLYITEIDNGFFVIDFTRHSWESQIHILSVQYVDMNDLLKNTTFHLPSDATYQAITFTGIQFSEHAEMQRVLITTKGYHNFEVVITYDQSDKIVATHLHRIYYRYGFYNAFNEVKSISGYVAIGYTLPAVYSMFSEFPKQYIAVYDSDDYQHQSQKGYSQRYILGAFPIDWREHSVFAFNKTYDFHTNGTRIGLIVSDPSRHDMYSASISKTLQFEVQKNFTNQTLSVTAYSDFSKFDFNVTLYQKGSDDDDDDHHHDDHSKTDQILFIVVVVVAAIIIIVFGAYIFHVVRKRTRVVAQQRVSLLTNTESFMDDRIARNDQPPQKEQNNSKSLVRQDSGYSSGDEDGDDEETGNNEQENKPVDGQQLVVKAQPLAENPPKVEQMEKLIEQPVEKPVEKPVQVVRAVSQVKAEIEQKGDDQQVAVQKEQQKVQDNKQVKQQVPIIQSQANESQQ